MSKISDSSDDYPSTFKGSHPNPDRDASVNVTVAEIHSHGSNPALEEPSGVHQAKDKRGLNILGKEKVKKSGSVSISDTKESASEVIGTDATKGSSSIKEDRSTSHNIHPSVGTSYNQDQSFGRKYKVVSPFFHHGAYRPRERSESALKSDTKGSTSAVVATDATKGSFIKEDQNKSRNIHTSVGTSKNQSTSRNFNANPPFVNTFFRCEGNRPRLPRPFSIRPNTNTRVPMFTSRPSKSPLFTISANQQQPLDPSQIKTVFAVKEEEYKESSGHKSQRITQWIGDVGRSLSDGGNGEPPKESVWDHEGHQPVEDSTSTVQECKSSSTEYSTEEEGRQKRPRRRRSKSTGKNVGGKRGKN